jgi:F-type H+-transporting ATPase subunit delta
MSTLSKTKKAAKCLLTLSLDQEGRVDEGKVRSILDSLRENPPLDHMSLLKEYHTEVRRLLPTYECKLELGESEQEEIRTRLSAKVNAAKEGNFALDSTRNSRLIAGYKLRVGDDVYEDSIDQRLENLRKSLS